VKVRQLHPWRVNPAEARAIQERLRNRVVTSPSPSFPSPLRTVAGIDVACPRAADTALAGVVVMALPGMEVLERQWAVAPLTFPYVPGYLSFREGESVVKALRKVSSAVDAFLFDGQGICHPRRFGLASHIGLLMDRPSVGCAKSRLLGKHSEPSPKAGSRRQIRDGGEVVGLALRTRRSVKPVYVSVGHLVDLPGAARIVLSCCRGYRHPEPLREAHRWVTQLGRQMGKGSPLAAAAGGGSC